MTDAMPIPSKPIKETRIFRSTFKTLENKSDDTIMPIAKDNYTALPYIADKSK